MRRVAAPREGHRSELEHATTRLVPLIVTDPPACTTLGAKRVIFGSGLNVPNGSLVPAGVVTEPGLASPSATPSPSPRVPGPGTAMHW